MEPKQNPQLGVGDFTQAEYRSNRFVADIAQGIEPGQLLDQNFWAHHAKEFRPWDRVEARAKDGTWFAELVVLDCSRTWARMKIIAVVSLTTSDVSQTQASEAEVEGTKSAFKVTHRGRAGWSVVRESDKAILLEGENTREAAELWLQNHVESEVKGKRATV